MGYKHPIVALTANAVAGQADIFLGNGFDDFISKPIDIRQLNNVLNKLIRDKQPPEVIEAAKMQVKPSEERPSESEPQPAIKPRFAEIFVRDAMKALARLEEIDERKDYENENSMRTYIINVHGMKSALANIGKMDLSAIASKLEVAGREQKLDIIASETPAFLKSLRAFAEELNNQKEKSSAADVNEDKPYLEKMLNAIKAACEEYDENSADKALAELKKAPWSPQTMELLDAIADKLLHSDFDEITEVIKRYFQ